VNTNVTCTMGQGQELYRVLHDQGRGQLAEDRLAQRGATGEAGRRRCGPGLGFADSEGKGFGQSVDVVDGVLGACYARELLRTRPLLDVIVGIRY
jgi:hypothetical protein